MAEAIKVTCVLVFMFAAIGAGIAWNEEKPDQTIWNYRIGLTALTAFSLVPFLLVHFRRDRARDYLRAQGGSYFNRDGFTFSVAITAEGGVAVLYIFFQNQFEGRSVGQIALRPARGVFLNRSDMETIMIRVRCEPAAFGVARLSLPISYELQGRRQSFEVGASVKYPEGKGKQLRFRDGIALRTDTNFQNSFGTALTVAGAATGMLVISSPAKFTLALPRDVAEDLAEAFPPEVKTLWQLGDEPLDLNK